MAGGFAIQSFGCLSTVSLRERCIPQPLNRLGPSCRMCFLRLTTFLMPTVNKNFLQVFPLSRQFTFFLRAWVKKKLFYLVVDMNTGAYGTGFRKKKKILSIQPRKEIIVSYCGLGSILLL